MSDRGKYHGQRLKAKDVLRLYAAGERDFRGTILRGCNFRDTDLSGADFSYTDIRRTQFVNSNLQQAKFFRAHIGLTNTWLITQLLLTALVATLLSLFQAFMLIAFGGLLIDPSSQYVLATRIILSLFISLVFIGAFAYTLIAYKEESKIFFYSALLSTSALTIVNAIFIIANIIGFEIIIVEFIIILTIAIVLAHVTKADGIDFEAITEAVFSIGFFAVMIFFSSSATSNIIRNPILNNQALTSGSISRLILLFMFTLIEIFMAAQSLKNYFLDYLKKDINFIYGNIFFAKINSIFTFNFGVSFSGANLLDSFFVEAVLENVNFTDYAFINFLGRKFDVSLGMRGDYPFQKEKPTVLTRVRWHNAKKLKYARFSSSNLQNRDVRKLLVSLSGVDQNFADADLRGVNLAGATLHRINLKGANLNGATLAGAELHGANLTNAQCVGTDFTGAYLTGACLEAWNIDETTTLKDIDCEYVFLKEQPDAKGNRERRPHNPDKVFQPGDFEKFFQETLDTVQILIRKGIPPEVFRATIQELIKKYNLTPRPVRSYKLAGDDTLVDIAVLPETDKEQFEKDADELQMLKLQTVRTQALLEGERKRADDVREIALGYIQALSSMQISNQVTNMNNPINSGDGGFINTGSMEGNVVNLGELSGQVTVQINQLPDAAPGADQRSLKDLLTELQAAIEAETELSDVEKKEALGEVGKLAEAGTQPQDNAMQRMAKRAASNLKSITEPLTEASNLVTVCKNLLPLILAVF